MTSLRPLARVLAVPLVLSACGTTSAPPDEASDVEIASEEAVEGAEERAERKAGEDGGDKRADRAGGEGGDDRVDDDGRGTPHGPREPGDRPGGGKAPGPASRPGRAPGVSFPAAGAYVYDQKGFEEFCSTTCERDRLPPRQRITVSHASSGPRGAVVVTRARASGDRLVRTRTRYTARFAKVTEVHLEYSYEAFDFARTYRPSPPVTTLRFPLRPGRSWSGSWRGRVSGSYSVAVTGREDFAGTPVARVETITRFRGDLEGKANATLWIDPTDGTVMRTAGNMTSDMGFGTYRTGFATSLRSRP